MRVDLKSQEGHTLIELLTAMSLMLVVMSTLMGTLIAFNHFTQTSDARAQSRDDIRAVMESMAREVRSANALALESGAETRVVSRGDQFDFIFKYRDPASPGPTSYNSYNLQRVRYCLNTATNTLYRQTQQWTTLEAPDMLPTTDCPGATYQTTRVIATGVTNGASRPTFVYNNSALASITNIRLQFYLDNDTTKPPPETELSTGFFLRNVNRRPSAEFTVTPLGAGHLLLNASSSTDPDGDSVEYTWTDGGATIATGPVVDYTGSSGTHTFTLTVTDTGHLTSSTQEVIVQ